MGHSRWVTTANCVCRVYIATKKPSAGLKILVQYIMRVYAPLMLRIKVHSSCVSGAKHVHTMIQSSRFLTELLPSKTMKEFDKCIHRNAYFGHPENILLAMCDDDRQPIRALAYRRILSARNILREIPAADIREYKIPLLKYNSEDYVDMINWQKIAPEQQTPPLLRDLVITEEYIDQLAMFKITDANFEGKIKSADDEEVQFDIELQKLPCHSQAVERCVKVVTEASKHVSSESQREGYIIAKVRHRCQMPSFVTKKQFTMGDTFPAPKL